MRKGKLADVGSASILIKSNALQNANAPELIDELIGWIGEKQKSKREHAQAVNSK
jgi:hypothetical protein